MSRGQEVEKSRSREVEMSRGQEVEKSRSRDVLPPRRHFSDRGPRQSVGCWCGKAGNSRTCRLSSAGWNLLNMPSFQRRLESPQLLLKFNSPSGSANRLDFWSYGAVLNREASHPWIPINSFNSLANIIRANQYSPCSIDYLCHLRA